MTRRIVLPLIALAALSASIAVAQTRDPVKTAPPAPPGKATTPSKDAPPTGAIPLPPGWTEADMQACMQACEAAGKVGENHAFLAQSVGTWQGKTTMWMAPGAQPSSGTCTYIITPIMDGRFIKGEMTGEMPGMPGPFNGFGIYGFDNTTQKFQSSWISNCGTAIMQGIGELSSADQTLNWKYAYTCPQTKKPLTMREIERSTGKDSKTLEMFTIDPKTNKEFKMMEIAFTRKPGGSAGATGSRSGH
ncbi:MAG: DUF1579 domain-containing protein [Phycisphaerales bacterium]|nr:DUF1579 domain-containing protein [Phycisphaerales bacterium]MCI0630848.1 DUF1579 domain-containing protein [Phycisphaerales bacterium]MCI0674660.1 DUF1579 domain-containing protein [Phycisphaerales bacterium]